MQMLSWITVKKFCELTNTDVKLVTQNIKDKKDLAKFSVLKERTYFINHQRWMGSLTEHLRLEEE